VCEIVDLTLTTLFNSWFNRTLSSNYTSDLQAGCDTWIFYNESSTGV